MKLKVVNQKVLKSVKKIKTIVITAFMEKTP
jgi:hypothetical protein